MASCKLTDEQVIEIITIHADLPQRVVGRLYGVSHNTVDAIKSGKRYAWVAPEIPRPKQPPPGPRCGDCWADHHGKCSLEFPERRGHLGDRAATMCAAYMTKHSTPCFS